MFRPAYAYLSLDEIRARARDAVAALAECRVCPRDCAVDRLQDKWAACKTGRYAVVGSHFPHFGEEDCLRGWNGSGTIFFSHCNLRCVFCQNHDISQAIKPTAPESRPSRPEEIAGMMLELQGRGCHNINFVTPEHVVPQVLEAVAVAVERGLKLPIVYNTSAYDALESLSWMDGIVDIYMPDFKYWSPERSRTYMKAADYPEAARAVSKEMHRQVGNLVVDANGLAKRGLIVRHLVMPGFLDETRAILEWVAAELGPDTYVNLMDQYYPAGTVSSDRYPEINRRLTSAEFREAQAIADELGLRNLDERRPHPRLGLRLALTPTREECDDPGSPQRGRAAHSPRHPRELPLGPPDGDRQHGLQGLPGQASPQEGSAEQGDGIGPAAGGARRAAADRPRRLTPKSREDR